MSFAKDQGMDLRSNRSMTHILSCLPFEPQRLAWRSAHRRHFLHTKERRKGGGKADCSEPGGSNLRCLQNPGSLHKGTVQTGYRIIGLCQTGGACTPFLNKTALQGCKLARRVGVARLADFSGKTENPHLPVKCT